MLKEFILALNIPCDIQAYGPFHVVFFLCGLFISIYLSFKLRKLSNKQNDILLLIIGLILLILEIFKQLYFYYLDDSYRWSIFPFQLCSIPMYLCIICYFLKSGMIKNCYYHFMSTYTLMSGLISFIEPSGLINKNLFLTLHSFIWHMCLVFIGLYLIITKRIIEKSYNFLLSSIFFVFLCNIAFLINVTFMDVSNNTINMFFIGPKINNLIIFKQIGEATNWLLATILYIPTVIFGAWLTSKLTNKLFNKEKKC